jgi:hypothetical protein
VPSPQAKLLKIRLISVGAALPLMTVLLGDLTNTFGGFTSGASSVAPVGPEEFKSEVPLFAT